MMNFYKMAEKSCEECQLLAPAMDFDLFTGYFLWYRHIIFSIKLNPNNRFAIEFTHFVNQIVSVTICVQNVQI